MPNPHKVDTEEEDTAREVTPQRDRTRKRKHTIGQNSGASRSRNRIGGVLWTDRKK